MLLRNLHRNYWMFLLFWTYLQKEFLCVLAINNPNIQNISAHAHTDKMAACFKNKFLQYSLLHSPLSNNSRKCIFFHILFPFLLFSFTLASEGYSLPSQQLLASLHTCLCPCYSLYAINGKYQYTINIKSFILLLELTALRHVFIFRPWTMKKDHY